MTNKIARLQINTCVLVDKILLYKLLISKPITTSYIGSTCSIVLHRYSAVVMRHHNDTYTLDSDCTNVEVPWAARKFFLDSEVNNRSQ